MNSQPTFFEVYDLTPPPMPPKFDGETIIEGWDAERLGGQWKRVFDVMSDGRYRTLEEIQTEILRTTGIHDSITGISARTRDFRKSKWGGHWVNSRRRGDEKRGVWEYSLEVK